MAECLLLAAALALALLWPYVDGRSVASLLLETLLSNFRAQAFLISIL